MAKKALVKPDLIHLINIRILKAHFEVSPDRLDESFGDAELDMGVKSESAFNIDEKSMRFRLFIKIKGSDESSNQVLSGDYHIEYHYRIENMKEFVDSGNEGEEYSINPILGATIAGISYSTARGILLDRTMATDFNGILLPVVDPNQLILEDSFSEMS